jgi:hypothetical protein
VLTRSPGLATAHVLFYRPADFPEGWEKTDLWRSAALLPGVAVWCDEDGVEANRFGAGTSGQVVLYDSEGALLFRGGVTAARGCRDGNPGLEALLSCLARGVPDFTPRPVFGCPLQNP